MISVRSIMPGPTALAVTLLLAAMNPGGAVAQSSSLDIPFAPTVDSSMMSLTLRRFTGTSASSATVASTVSGLGSERHTTSTSVASVCRFFAIATPSGAERSSFAGSTPWTKNFSASRLAIGLPMLPRPTTPRLRLATNPPDAARGRRCRGRSRR